MLENVSDLAEKLIEDIGRQAGIERVRVLNSDGKIIHSKRRAETGWSLAQKDEPCVRCHQGTQPLQKVADQDRWRVYQDAQGHRLLAAMEPIRNEPSCANASCHEHPASQSVLGVVDIAYSLDELDATLNRHVRIILAVSAITILAVAVVVAWLLQCAGRRSSGWRPCRAPARRPRGTGRAHERGTARRRLEKSRRRRQGSLSR